MSVEHCCNIKGKMVWYNKPGTCIHTCWEMIGAITITKKCPWYWTYKTVAMSIYRSYTLFAILVVHNSLLFARSQQKPLICCSRSYWAVYSLCGEGNDWEPSQSLVPAMQGNTYLEMYLRKRKQYQTYVLVHWAFHFIAKLIIEYIHCTIYISDLIYWQRILRLSWCGPGEWRCLILFYLIMTNICGRVMRVNQLGSFGEVQIASKLSDPSSFFPNLVLI